ncbi:lysylphosphatidylglycerol synthase transmembrane domain-containing protein [Nitrosomonas sp.]|uniref:lysylphosphatidylglycerol synthase transmembrane domain-containing protein n=1 Tax=Nitrosomonas sp. TaxID=42353 RepID=UPI00272C57EB|nr:lysylphosphatidylglycerol synthase transmembrane domain-containing protein [Nitrosomonas sp.]
MIIKNKYKWTMYGIVIGCLFFWFSLRGIDIHSVLESLRAVELMPAMLVLPAGVLFMLIKAWRWAVILGPVARVELPLLHSAIYMGTAANLSIAHSGELLRAMLIGRRSHIATTAVLASIGVERIFDFMVVVALFGVLLIIDPQLPEYVAVAGFIALFMVGAGLLTIVVLSVPSKVRYHLRLLVISLLPEKFLELNKNQLKRGLVGFSALSNPSIVVNVFLLSVLQWGCIVSAIWLCAYSAGYALTISMAISVWVLMVIGLTLPSSPAQLGTTQLAFTLGLSMALHETEIPFAASLIYTVCLNLPYMLIGMICWIKVGKIDRRIASKKRSAEIERRGKKVQQDSLTVPVEEKS